MKLFNKKEEDFSKASFKAFEEMLLGKKEKSNPVVKGGSMVLYIIVAIALAACVLMAVLDSSGKTQIQSQTQPQNQTETTASATEETQQTDAVDLSAYPVSLQKLYKKNPEAADFVLDYFDEKDKQKEVSLRKYKKGDKMPLFLQWDKQWGYMKYGDDFAGVKAAGPMCVAMVGYHLTKNEEKFSPDKVIEFATSNGYYKKGATASIMTDGAAKLGLVSTQITPSSENIISSLQAGNPLVCYIGAGKFTNTGHYVVIHSFSEGYLLINDPMSAKNSEKNWLFADIASQIKGIWEISAAL